MVQLLALKKARFSSLSDRTRYRILECIPGVLVWCTLIAAIVLSLTAPLWAIGFIILFDLYWLIRVTYVLIYLVMGYRRYRAAIRVDWVERCNALPRWRSMYHLVFYPTANEPLDVVRATFQSLARSKYPLDRLIVVLGTEKRTGENSRIKRETIQREFGSVFGHLFCIEHPGDLPGELIGKGSNLNWSGHRVKEIIDNELHIPYDDIIVSSFDIDTQPHEQYFACLTHAYLTHPHPTRTSYQPIPLYNNNIWESPALMRVAANSTTFWLMTEQIRPERLFTFSSHSMSFRALVDVGFWQNDIVTEDSRIFLQCLLRYDGDYSVTPIYLPVSMDTVKSHTLWRSLKNLYKQQRRWAYGVENFPYMAWNFGKNPLIPFRSKARYIWNQLEGVYSWATAPILIFVLGRLPLMANKDALGSSILAHNAPFMLQILLTIAMVGLFISAILSTTLLPPRPARERKTKFLFMLLQWALFPITMIVFGAIPATDAQTRLMLGKYLGFWVTEKTR